MPPHISVEGGYNVRDLGGYSTKDGFVTREKVLIRAGSLDKLSDAGQQQLIDYGVKTIIDVRDEWEVREFPNVFAQSTLVTYLSLPLVGKQLSDDKQWNARTENYTQLYEFYCQYLDVCQPQIGIIVTAVAESTSATLFHCYAGKDRTGILAALLLDVVGVQDAVIATDYAQTSQYITHLVAEWRKDAEQNERDMKQFERDTGAESETMLNMLQYLKQSYGNVQNYLHLCGVSNHHLEQLKSRFVS